MDIAQVRSMLASILAEIDGGVPGAQTTQAPPGFVYVVPTGPEGAGKARLWPQPHPEQGEMLLGYATRCMNTIDQTTTLPYYPRGQYGMILQGAAHGNPNFAEALDRIHYQRDWMTQAELDNAAALAARDAADGNVFSPR